MWAERLTVCRSEATGKKSRKGSLSTQAQDTMEVRHKTAIGKKVWSLLAKGKPIKVRKPIK